MATRRSIKERNSEKVTRERAAIPWRQVFLSISCALVLALGFFYAAKQHFTTVDLSMRNSDMRDAKKKLEEQKTKLKVERETAGSHANIEKAGAKIGLVKFSSMELQYIDPNGNVTVAGKPVAAAGKTVAANEKAKNAKGAKESASAKTETAVKVEKKEQPRRAGSDVAKNSANSTRENIRTLIARK